MSVHFSHAIWLSGCNPHVFWVCRIGATRIGHHCRVREGRSGDRYIPRSRHGIGGAEIQSRKSSFSAHSSTLFAIMPCLVTSLPGSQPQKRSQEGWRLMYRTKSAQRREREFQLVSESVGSESRLYPCALGCESSPRAPTTIGLPLSKIPSPLHHIHHVQSRPQQQAVRLCLQERRRKLIHSLPG